MASKIKRKKKVRELYRACKAGIFFDDAYGVWTEADQASAGGRDKLLDQEESRKNARERSEVYMCESF
jgi:hypothetical protein